jgi:hypothetical protein
VGFMGVSTNLYSGHKSKICGIKFYLVQPIEICQNKNVTKKTKQNSIKIVAKLLREAKNSRRQQKMMQKTESKS